VPRTKKYNKEPISNVTIRLADRNECKHYIECLTEAAKKARSCLPCVDCTRYIHAPPVREYVQKRYVESCW
jgi:hypothetical protein